MYKQRTSGRRAFIRLVAVPHNPFLCLGGSCTSKLEDEGTLVTHLRRLNDRGRSLGSCGVVAWTVDRVAPQPSRRELLPRMQHSYSNVLARGFWCMKFLLNQFELVLSHI